MTDVNVGGQNFSLQLDTGSSDLWLHSPTPVNTTNTTDTLITLTYGLGSAAGKVDYASLAIGDYTIPEQAFVNANRVEHQDLSGIFPLGLDSLSVIYSTLSELSDEDAVFTPAQPPLSSLFTQGTQEENTNFIGLALERSEDQENVSGGILSIGEYDPRFPLIANATPIALASASRWTIPLEGLAINGKPAPLASSVRHAKPGTSIALIDSGTTLAYIPEATVDAIYGAIPGSKHLTHDGNNVWLVPCLASANVTLQFGGDTFAVDPLDLTIVTTSIQANGSTYTVCVNAFQAQAAGIPGEVDMILGDTFMRNVYSVYVHQPHFDASFGRKY
ncbi:hypothetical protein PLICRDRAFT_663523 [Plicaturopsis crispa FD-325 SS-3]|nr:hypothetical protein PLICRDRAFT_663523 [Plicaturopsis crispa FD-325 SS-3]